MELLTNILAWLGRFWESLPLLLQDFFIWIINKLIELAAKLFEWVIVILPKYTPPILNLHDNGWPVLRTLNWLIPVSFCIKLVSTFILAYTLLWAVGGILRRLRVIR